MLEGVAALYVLATGAAELHEARLCAGSSDVKMLVAGGGVKVVPAEEREECSSKDKWKKYSGITGGGVKHASQRM